MTDNHAGDAAQARVAKLRANPSSYLGPIQLVSGSYWVFESGSMTYRNARFCPALYRLVDNIFLVMCSIPRVSAITVDISPEFDRIKLKADVPLPNVTEVLEAEFYFTGAFSHSFVVEGGGVRIEYRDHMADVRRIACETDGFLVEFSVDFTDFATADTFAVLTRRIYDLAVLNRAVTFVLNGNQVTSKRWYQYARMFRTGLNDKVLRHSMKDAYAIYVLPSERGQFHQLTFMNGLWTSEGAHIRYMKSQIVSYLVDSFGCDMKTAENHLFIFLDCTIVNPQFADASKLVVTTGLNRFANWRLSIAFLEKVARGAIAAPLSTPLQQVMPRERSHALAVRVRVALDDLMDPSTDAVSDEQPDDGGPDELAYYGIVSDLPMNFGVGNTEGTKPTGLIKKIMDRIARKSSFTDLIVKVYRRDMWGICRHIAFWGGP
jgi:hypothetical protein